MRIFRRLFHLFLSLIVSRAVFISYENSPGYVVCARFYLTSIYIVACHHRLHVPSTFQYINALANGLLVPILSI